MPITIKDSEGNDVELPTAEELKQSQAELINTTVNAAITTHLKRELPRMSAEVAKVINSDLTKTIQETLVPSIDEKIAALKPKEEPGAPPKVVPVTDTPEYRALQKQVAELQEQRRKDADKAAAAEAQSRDTRLRQHVSEALANSGITDPTLSRIALGHLVDSTKRVKFDDAGENVLFIDPKLGELPLTDGIAEFMKTEESKIFIPAKKSGGSGEIVQRKVGTRPVGEEYSRSEIGAALAELAQGKLG
jgi:hypothetical protein